MTGAVRMLVVAGTLSGAAAPSQAQRAAPPARPARTPEAAARSVVRAFYAYHFAHDMAFTAAAVRRRTAWLAPDLVALCRTYFTAPSNPDEVPSIDGDAFTDTQEYPRSFRVSVPTHVVPRAPTADTMLVPVTFAWPGTERRTITVVVVPVRGSWRIADVRYPDGPSLRQLLAAGPEAGRQPVRRFASPRVRSPVSAAGWARWRP